MDLEEYIKENWSNEAIYNASKGVIARCSLEGVFTQNLVLEYCEEEHITFGDLLKASDSIHAEYGDTVKLWLIFCVINLSCINILRKNTINYETGEIKEKENEA